eukprot:1189158-Pyramimonas_sp.AAC.1
MGVELVGPLRFVHEVQDFTSPRGPFGDIVKRAVWVLQRLWDLFLGEARDLMGCIVEDVVGML